MEEHGDAYWKATLDILAGKEHKKPRKDILADVEEWLNRVAEKIAKQKVVKEDGAKDGKKGRRNARNSKVAKVAKVEYYETLFGKHIEIECNFNNPRIRSRLEKLMGTNIVRITDRKYMIRLQERIKEDHLENQKKRIQEREAEEVEREKKLILEGKIPIEEAPQELRNHPVCRINQITKKILEDKRAKMKKTDKTTPSKTTSKKIRESDRTERSTEWEASPERGEEEGEETEATARAGHRNSILGLSEPEAIEEIKGFMFCKDEYEKLKYEAPLVKALKEVENVDEMYTLADEIVGPLKNEKLSK